MPKISEKAILMPASPIRKLVPYAEKAKKAGKIVYHLNIGQPDIETPEVALNAVRNMDRKVIEYSHSLVLKAIEMDYPLTISKQELMYNPKIL